MKVTKEEELKLIDIFGEFWSIKLFNKYHIALFINKLNSNSKIKEEILNKYGDKWLVNFLNKFKTNIIFRKINYSYNELIKFQYKVKMGKKLEKIDIDKEDIEEVNFETQKNNNNILNNNILEGGKKNNNDNNDNNNKILLYSYS